MKNKKYYIAYGSNLNLPQMDRRCPNAILAAEAELNNYQILFRGRENSAVATIEPSEGDSVPVLIWELTKKDEEALDRYEGFPFFYHKEFMDIETDEGMAEAMVYVMNDGYEIGMPSDYYMNAILDGYEVAGFDPTAIEKALEISKQHVQQHRQNEMDMDF